MNTEYIESHLKCTKEEKNNCVQYLEIMIEVMDISRRYGLLQLDYEVSKREKWNQIPSLVRGIELIADGTDPEIVKKIMSNYIIADGDIGETFLKNMIIMEGILEVQQGCSRRAYIEILQSYFGSEFITVFENLNVTPTVNVFEKIDIKQACYSDETQRMEKYLSVHFRSIQRILREVEMMDLVVALYGASGKIKSVFIGNVTQRTAYIMYDLLQEINPTERDIIRSQKLVDTIAQELEEQGEIIRKNE